MNKWLFLLLSLRHTKDVLGKNRYLSIIMKRQREFRSIGVLFVRGGEHAAFYWCHKWQGHSVILCKLFSVNIAGRLRNKIRLLLCPFPILDGCNINEANNFFFQIEHCLEMNGKHTAISAFWRLLSSALTVVKVY